MSDVTNPEEWGDFLDPQPTKRDAERLASWMRRGEWPTKLVKIGGKWHVLTRDRDRTRGY